MKHTRQQFTSRGPDPWVVTRHTFTVGRMNLTITDGPCMVAETTPFIVGRIRVGRTVFISEVINRWAYPLVERLFNHCEDRYEAALWRDEYEGLGADHDRLFGEVD